MVVSKTRDHILIKIKMPNPNQEPPASSKAPNEDLKDMDVCCTFKIQIESQNLDPGCIKEQTLNPNQEEYVKHQSGTSSILKSPKLGLRGHGCSLHLQIKIECQNLDHWCIKDKWPYPNQDQDSRPQSGPSSILQSPKRGLKGHGCSLHLQNQYREPKFGIWVYQRPVDIYKSISLPQTNHGTRNTKTSVSSTLKTLRSTCSVSPYDILAKICSIEDTSYYAFLWEFPQKDVVGGQLAIFAIISKTPHAKWSLTFFSWLYRKKSSQGLKTIIFGRSGNFGRFQTPERVIFWPGEPEEKLG